MRVSTVILKRSLKANVSKIQIVSLPLTHHQRVLSRPIWPQHTMINIFSKNNNRKILKQKRKSRKHNYTTETKPSLCILNHQARNHIQKHSGRHDSKPNITSSEIQTSILKMVALSPVVQNASSSSFCSYY